MSFYVRGFQRGKAKSSMIVVLLVISLVAVSNSLLVASESMNQATIGLHNKLNEDLVDHFITENIVLKDQNQLSNLSSKSNKTSSSNKIIEKQNFVDKNQLLFELENIPSNFLNSSWRHSSKWALSGLGGAPALPVRAYKILLPVSVDSESVNMKTVKQNRIVHNKTYYIPKVPYPVRQTENSSLVLANTRTDDVFTQDAFWPQEIISSVNIKHIRDAVMLEFNYYPYQYNPVRKTLREYRDVELAISWEKDSFSRGVDPLTKDYLLNYGNSIDNLAVMLPSYEKDTFVATNDQQSDTPGTTYVIVTTNAIKTHSQKLDDFVRYKQALGFNVMIITEDEYGTADGHQRVLNIRNWLQSHYVSDAIQHLTLE